MAAGTRCAVALSSSAQSRSRHSVAERQRATPPHGHWWRSLGVTPRMKYLRAFTVGVLAAVAALFVWLLVSIASVQSASTGAGIGAVSISMFNGLLLALAGFVLGFVWALVRGPRHIGPP